MRSSVVLYPNSGRRTTLVRGLLVALFALLTVAGAMPLEAQGRAVRPDGVTPIVRGRRAELRVASWIGRAQADLAGATLYYTTDAARTWVRSDSVLSRPRVEGDAPFFPFTATQDGDFGFRYVLRNEAAPRAGDMTHGRVHFDATPPTLSVSKPNAGDFYVRGEAIQVDYTASDTNLDEVTGFDVEYSYDGDRWERAIAASPVTGSASWVPPVTEPRNIAMRFTVRDKASNVGQVVVQNIGVGQPGRAFEATSELELMITAPEVIYFENTDFFYTATNPTGAAIAYVAIWYTMDGGATWKTGGANYSGDAEGTVTVHFPPGFRRGAAYGNFEQIGFHYQLVLDNNRRTADDAIPGTQAMASIPVDTDAPSLHVTMPSLGDKLYRGAIPNNWESGKYFIGWGGADMNPIPYIDMPGYERGPVTIEYTANPHAPEADKKWVVLADRQPIRVGRFIKTNDLPLGEVQIRIRAEDQMGNTTQRTTGVITVVDGSGYVAPERGRGDVEVDRLWGEGTLAYRNGDYAAAIKKFDSALEIAPDDRAASVRHDRAVALNADGRTNDAILELRKCIESAPGNLTFRYTLATIYFRNDRKGEARDQLEEVVKRDAREPHIRARSMLSTIEYQAGNGDRAITLWKYIMEHGSKDSEEYKAAEANLKRENVIK